MILKLLKFPFPGSAGELHDSLNPRGHAQTVAAMLRTMYHERGLSLCSRQVAVDVRIIVMNTSGNESGRVKNFPPFEKVFVNPKIVKASDERETAEEACLSVPGVRQELERPKSCVVESLSRVGKPQSHDLKDLDARAFMHALEIMDERRWGTIAL